MTKRTPEYLERTWKTNIKALKRFVGREGHARVPALFEESGLKLGQWVCVQRKNESKMPDHRKKALETVKDWSWSPLEDDWNNALQILKQFVVREGHAQVPARYVEDDFELGHWVSNQRTAKQRMSLKRKKTLESISGWSWTPVADDWNNAFQILKKFIRREGHSRVPARYIEGGYRLGQWVTQQRGRIRMPAHERKALEALTGWLWDPSSTDWNRAFEMLEQFTKREGHARVSFEHAEDGFRLGQWINGQRRRYKRNNMPLERAKKFESLPGWSWVPNADEWEKALWYLKRFVKREGHARVPQNHMEGDFWLGQWVMARRRDGENLPSERIDVLESICGWVWDSPADEWNYAFELLKQFTNREGHAEVPQAHVEEGCKLGVWAGIQRVNRKTISSARAKALESLEGWSWEVFNDRWDRAYAVLLEFFQQEGHCLVPNRCVYEEFKLGQWVVEQRKRFKQGFLSEDRRERLESIFGWVWNAREELKWLRRYRGLIDFIQREGHIGVPIGHMEGKIDLGDWLDEQYESHDDGTLSDRHRNMLEAIPGWRWV